MLNKKTFLITLFILHAFLLTAQHQTSSPYSSYGFGLLRKGGFAYNMGMGYTGIALNSAININQMNPASYTSFPDQRFTLETGLKYNMSNFKSANQSQRNFDLNIDYLSIGFPITDFWAVAAGLTPYSSVGYKINDKQDDYTTQYEGTGGLNEVKFGTAFELFNHISIGINGSYIFGETEETIITEFEPEISNSILIRNDLSQIDGLNIDAGIQGDFKLGGFNINIGAIYNKEKSLNAERDLSTVQILNINEKNFTDTVISGDSFNGTLSVPSEYGVGINISNEQIKVSADYMIQDWGGTDFYKQTVANFAKEETLKFGAELTPGEYSTQYYKIIHYRLGGYYKNSYLQLPIKDGSYQQIKSYGITAGLLLPVPNSGALFNLGFDMGTFGTTANNLLAENYLTINFGFVFKDIWFRKRKFN